MNKKAQEWWNSHMWLVHQELTFQYFGNRSFETLAEKEIEFIWENEAR